MSKAINSRNNHYCVILAGGVGRRFWPYSRRNYPKQFIDFLGTGESLLQMTFRRFREYFPVEQIVVVTNEGYRSIVEEQLPELEPRNLLLESSHRNTASAIAYATGHILARNPQAILLISPSDHLITKEAPFIQHTADALAYAERYEGILTMGIRPSYPETGYGYIQAVPNEVQAQLQEGHIYPVKTFTEKPNKHMAKVLLESGEFYWNSGIFVAQATSLLAAFKEHLTELYERLFIKMEVWGSPEEASYVAEVYPYCPNISFDYGVMEHVEEVQMVLCDVGWTDLGSWGAVYAITEKDAHSNAVVGEANVLLNDSNRNLVMTSQPDTLVVLQGVDDLIVVQNKDVLMVCRKGQEHKLKQVVPDAQGLGDKYID